MIDVVENFLLKYNLTSSACTHLVAFSGGCDSLCLLDIFRVLSEKYNFNLVALHVNHNWRKEESYKEEMNCREYCKKNAIELLVETLSENVQKSENLAREARYSFFLSQAKKYNNSAIFTGHTSSDNAETIVYRLIKGTGVVGLQGILPSRKLGQTPIYRPILTLTREQTEDYCNSKGLIANNDSSNFDVNYKRNFIRHKIMPLFKEINFNSEKAINNLANMAISHNNIVDEYISQIMKDIYVDKKLLTPKFRLLSDDVKKKIIYNGCQKFNIDYDSKKITNILEFIKENFDSKSGSRFSITNDLWLFVNSRYIYLINQIKSEFVTEEIKIDAEGEFVLPAGETFSIEKFVSEESIKFPKESDLVAYVNLSDLDLNFVLRTRRDGDFIIPFGMQGHMKLKKYLNSKGISQHQKDSLLMLCCESEVLWVCGVGLSNKLKVVNRPTHVLRLRHE